MAHNLGIIRIHIDIGLHRFRINLQFPQIWSFLNKFLEVYQTVNKLFAKS